MAAPVPAVTLPSSKMEDVVDAAAVDNVYLYQPVPVDLDLQLQFLRR